MLSVLLTSLRRGLRVHFRSFLKLHWISTLDIVAEQDRQANLSKYFPRLSFGFHTADRVPTCDGWFRILQYLIKQHGASFLP
jgi:hypothetical protein